MFGPFRPQIPQASELGSGLPEHPEPCSELAEVSRVFLSEFVGFGDMGGFFRCLRLPSKYQIAVIPQTLIR